MTPIEQEAYDAALELIKACQREQSTVLWLRCLDLTRLPPEIGQLANLTGLNLAGNQLTTLPPEIGQLANLQELSLSNNQLSVLPPEIGQLVNLTELFLSNNQLSTLPPEFGQLANLTLLSLSGNQLSILPPEIARLTQLEELMLEGNALRALPQSLKGLARLKILTLHGNDALGLPTEVLGPPYTETINHPPAMPQKILEYYFTKLGSKGRGLWAKVAGMLSASPKVQDRDMTSEEQIGYDRALKKIEACRHERSTVLDLSDLGLTRLPPMIGQLANLTRLDLRYNKLSTLPPEFGRLANLTALSLHDNQLRMLPPELGQLANLTTLLLSNNQLSPFPLEICQFAKLTKLSLGGNQLSTLPPEIGQLANLTELHLSDNQLSTLPPEIGQLTKLTGLFVAGNQLSTLPPEIGRLKQLEQLNLEGNALHALPETLMGLTRLTMLTLHWNDALGLPADLLGPIFLEANDENPPTNPQAILDYYFIMRGAEVIEHLYSDAKESVIRELEQEAVSAHAPVGLFGTKWLMPMNEVISIVPSAYTEPTSPNILKVFRKFYEREAFINFQFDDDRLMMIWVLFFGPSSSEDFDRTQARLSMDYGTMSAPVFSDKDILVSRREVNRFAILHSLREMDCGPLEMVSFYRSK